MKPTTTKRAAATRGPQPHNQPALDSVEKMLLGGTPDDGIAISAQAADAMRDPRVARLDAARNYLVDVPELRAELARDIKAAWSRAGGRRSEFLHAVAERRAQLLSLAELRQFRDQTPHAIADFHSELSRYLLETAGQSDDTAG
jgi:hypothetical protein